MSPDEFAEEVRGPGRVLGVHHEADDARPCSPGEDELDAVAELRRVSGVSPAWYGLPAPAVVLPDTGEHVAPLEIRRPDRREQPADAVQPALRVRSDADAGVVIHRHDGEPVDEIGLGQLVAGVETQDAALGLRRVEIVHVGALECPRDRSAEGAGVQPPMRAIPAVDQRTGVAVSAVAAPTAGVRRRLRRGAARSGGDDGRRQADSRGEGDGRSHVESPDRDLTHVGESDAVWSRPHAGAGILGSSDDGVADDPRRHEHDSPSIPPGHADLVGVP